MGNTVSAAYFDRLCDIDTMRYSMQIGCGALPATGSRLSAPNQTLCRERMGQKTRRASRTFRTSPDSP